MLRIYHIEARRSDRVVWLMEELGLDYELIFTPKDIAASLMAIKAVHPIGAAPTVRDGDLWLCESGAILEYVVNRHGGGRFGVKPDAPGYPQYLQWMHFAEGSAMGRIINEMMIAPMLAASGAPKPPIAGLFAGNSRRLLDFFEQSLAGQDYFAGEDFSAADIMMLMPVRAARRACQGEVRPNVEAWCARVEARPAYARMLARALPNGPPPTLAGWPKEDAQPV